ncbi:unnamed protein product [Mytilus edulis]|uniref:CARD domain-containing protein n=1 Tax=Mytilus edulis TaxID=6550 RepID=A0A8S3QCS7_MYTED|nr:unnamed protein product [Mytilus edulis]
MKDIPKLVSLKRLFRNTKLDLNLMEDRNMEESNRPRSTIPTDNAVDRIRSSYSRIKQRLLDKIDKLEDYMLSEVLNFDDFILAMINPIDSEKIDIILTSVLRKGSAACDTLIQFLERHDFLRSDELKDDKTGHLMGDSAQFSNVHAYMFSNPRLCNYLRDELEIDLIIDDMYEWHLIELDTHERIRQLTERVHKVNVLLSEMERITDNAWFIKFCCFLTKHAENTIVIENIRQTASMAHMPETTRDEDLTVAIGRTFKIRTENLTEERLRQLHIDDMNSQLQQPHHIFDVRDGCVELILFNSTNEFSQENCLEFIRKVIEIEDVKSTLIPGQIFNVAVRAFDQNIPLLDDNGKSLLKFPIKLALKLNEARVDGETNQKLSSKDVEIQKQYIVYALSNCSADELETILQKSKDLEKCKVIYDCVQRWKCLNCYRQSILSEKERVLNEIDTAIIKQTLDGQHELPKCLYEYWSCLVAFAEVLATRSKLCIKHTQCRTCSGMTTLEEENKEAIVFNFVINDIGELVPEETNQEPSRPDIYQENTDTQVTARGKNGKHTPGRQQSMNEFFELPMDRKYRHRDVRNVSFADRRKTSKRQSIEW